MPTISVFGSGSPVPGSADYELARQMGQLLAEAGYTVQTGGYSGVMSAASQGASEVGGHVVGVTSNLIEIYRPTPINQWVAEEIRYRTQRERLYHLVEQCDGVIAMSGGIGTLSELALTWSLVQVGEIPVRPIITVGGLWARSLNAFINPDYIKPEHINLIKIARTPKEAIALLPGK